MKRSCTLSLALSLSAATVFARPVSRGERLHLFPQLNTGQSLRYLVRLQADRQVKTQSNMVSPMAPVPQPLDTNTQLIVEILDVRPAGAKAVFHARAHFQDSDPGASQSPAAPSSSTLPSVVSDAPAKIVEFTLFPDGHVEQVIGLDLLTPEQQQSWREWLSLFAVAGVFPSEGVKPTEKWKSDVPQSAPAPIADLHWENESTYVNDEPCGSAGPGETCAVILTRSILKQKSSPKNSTPEDFKLHQLRTLGTASGANETITYISLKSGLVLRATEEASQLMDLTIATSDGSNAVHYNIDAKSHAEIILLPASPPPSN
jgi:hypothetical protein